jgi:PPOX class probable FMN-dependent enzyme
MDVIGSIEQLEALYGTPLEASIVKEVPRITPHYAALIAASPFVALATGGPEGLDCSPRGDAAGFVRVVDETTLQMPDRRGNNRADSLRNIVRDPRVGLLFMIPGIGTTLRVNGRARLRIDAPVLDAFVMEGKRPRCVIEIAVETVYYQCARAIVRSELWNPDKFVAPARVPSAGQMLAALTAERIDGEAYDQTWAARAKETLW